jgi:hypothetical protein
MLRAAFGAGAAVLVLAMTATSGSASTIYEAMTRAADNLTSSQATSGCWPGDADYTGPIVAGLVNAYELTAVEGYRTAAEKGGTYITTYAPSGNYLGDEAYGLSRLIDVSSNPIPWTTAVTTFYDTTVRNSTGGTSGYIDRLINGYSEQSVPVFYLAHHAIAANAVSAVDKATWRTRLVQTLGQVTDDDWYPVMSLGTAVWALAQTGPLDGTLVAPGAPGGSLWDGVKLSDLPGMLAGDVVASGGFAGSFYWRFDHTNGGSSAYAAGYTEDTSYSILGLVAADEANPALGYDALILSAREALAAGVSPDGDAADHIWYGSTVRYVYTGETVEALPEPATAILLLAGGMLVTARRRRLSTARQVRR